VREHEAVVGRTAGGTEFLAEIRQRRRRALLELEPSLIRRRLFRKDVVAEHRHVDGAEQRHEAGRDCLSLQYRDGYEYVCHYSAP